MSEYRQNLIQKTKYKKYLKLIYPDNDDNDYYLNKLIKNYEENGYDAQLENDNLTLPMKQYKIYKLRNDWLEEERKSLKIEYNTILNMKEEYKFRDYDNNFRLYLKLLYPDKSKDYLKSRKCYITKKIKNNDMNAFVLSMIECDKIMMLLRDLQFWGPDGLR